MTRPRFHLAFPVTDLEETKGFYVDLLGARAARSAERWLDLNFWGHQLSAHLVDSKEEVSTNPVDGEQVPARHFGVILPWEEWTALAARLECAGVQFIIEPQVRFEGQVGEQATMFFCDPSGNALEFKSFRDDESVLAVE